MAERDRSKPLTISELLTVGINSLSPGAKWCICHAEGPLLDTASLDFTRPIMIACGALDVDWDHLTENGFWLGQVDMASGKIVEAWQR